MIVEPVQIPDEFSCWAHCTTRHWYYYPRPLVVGVPDAIIEWLESPEKEEVKDERV